MASVRPRGEVIRVSLAREEAALLVSLASQVAALLRSQEGTISDASTGEGSTFEQMVAGLDAGPPAPEGPILERLLPDGYRDDPQAAEEFRRLTDGELRATKGRALQRMLDDIETAGGLTTGGKPLKIDLDVDAAESWLRAINDVRLALGTHLDIREEGDAEQRAVADEQERHSYEIYDWLTWLQESIVRPMIG